MATASCTYLGSLVSSKDSDDVAITRSAKSALMASDKINAAPLRVSNKGDVMQLSGSVESDEERLEAERVLRSLYPDITIENLIKVR